MTGVTGNGRLAGKVALVTGAAQGTGAGIAERFVEEGAKVVLGDILVDKGEALAAKLGPSARFVRLDVSNEADWEAAVLAAREAFGDVSILINNAAVLVMASIENTPLADYERAVRINQIGPFLGIRTVAPIMKAAGGGSIVNIGSTDGVFPGDQGLIAYAATKWALRGMTKVAAVELGRYGIRVNVVNPDAGNPMIGRPFLPPEVSDADLIKLGDAMAYRILKRLHPERKRIDEVVAMVLLLASDEGSGCTGGDYAVDGGYSAGTVGLADFLSLSD
ncbi:3-alpha-hydroxysteroid dehydrogenase [Sphingomonas sp. DBB INV C78]|uniref:SDR family oxidoreductase n=1 Tax=Sphingomonas sp. DBB INV C78 TaxID=3349434 RepID=UPI0036D2640B